MRYRNIALLGKAGAGKDTVAARLVQRYAYTRIAFADPVKEMSLELDPYVPTSCGVTVRLSALIADVGWDYAKTAYPEVRRILQRVGQSVRQQDPNFWADIAYDKIRAAHCWHLPVVVTDVRYENEAEMLRDCGFTFVRVTRPGAGLSGAEGAHASETALDNYAVRYTLHNTGSLADLHALVDALPVKS